MEESVAATLKEARTQQGFDISAVAEITHVRKEYLLALEEGRYQDLPEDIYARNFLRLYAQALGLDDSSLLDRYTRERRSALGIIPSEVALTQPATVRESQPAASRAWILTVLLLAALAGLAYFVYSRNLMTALFNPRAAEAAQVTPTIPVPVENTATIEEEVLEPNASLAEDSPSLIPESDTPTLSEQTSEAVTDTSETAQENPPLSEGATESEGLTSEDSPVIPDALANPVQTTATAASDTNTSNTTEPTEVSFTLITDPPGADASIDNYPFATRTPVFNAPVTARDARVLRIELEGYQPYEELLDVQEDTSLSITLLPLGATEANLLNPETQTSAVTPAPGTTTQGQLSLKIEAETWLEVYQSTERGSGERLYYGTAQIGETLAYSLPVYVHVGNAAGIRLSENGRDIGLMGSSGEVTGRAFGEPLSAEETTSEPPSDEPATEDTE